MKIEHAGNTLRVSEVAELDAATASSFQDAVEAAVTDAITHIEVDLADTVFLDSCGLGTLVALRKLVGNPGPSVRQMLELTRLYRVLEVVKREEIGATPT